MAKIYTRTGDSGTTGLVGGCRINKDNPIAHVVGNLDELNASLGLVQALLFAHPSDTIPAALNRIQNELFEIGSIVAGVKKEFPDEAWMEELIDQLWQKCPPLKNFILPGGSHTGAHLHLARAVCRRVERSAVPLLDGPLFMDDGLVRYLNRLSDLLFAMGRYENHRNVQREEIWYGS